MKRLAMGAALCMILAGPVGADDFGDDAGRNWPQWRGPGSQAVSSTTGLPTTWSETENVNWKFAIPGTGNSSPVVWGDKVFVTSAIPQGEDLPEGHPDRGRGVGPGGPPPTIQFQFELYCLDRKSGRVLWQRTARVSKPKEGINRIKGSYANGTPATDGEHVYAFFGSQGLYCYDMQGEPKWERDFGDMEIIYMNGEGASPVLHGDRILIIWDELQQSFLTALDKKTGETIWTTDRDEDTNWTTPVVIEHEGKKLIAANGTNKVRAYDYETGEVLWECAGMTRAAIPTIVYGHGMVFATSGYRGNALKAIKLGAGGDLTDSDAIVWSLDKGTPYVPSPLLHGDEIYVVDDKGIVSCFDARTGKQNYGRTRIEGLEALSASPVAADGKLYFLGEDGTTVVLEAGPEFKILATNRIDERFIASPAVASGAIYLRGEKHLYSIGGR